MKTTLAGDSPMKQFLDKLKESGVNLDPTCSQVFTVTLPKIGATPTQAYLLDGGYRLLLVQTRGWLLSPNEVLEAEIKLLPESEMTTSLEYITERFVSTK